MAVLSTLLPQLAPLLTRTFNTLSASDTVPLQANSRYLLHFKNTTGGALTATIDDPTSVQPSGATAFNPDVSTGSIPATTGEGYIYIQNSDRFRDANGNVTITGATGAQLTIIGPLA